MRHQRNKHQKHRFRRLKTRLFLWFLGAIVLAIASSALTVALTRPEQTEGPVRIVSRTIAARLSRDWDDARASEAYVSRLRDPLGLDLELVRDPETLPHHVRRAGGRGAPVMFTHDGRGFIPIVRGGMVLGAVRFDSGTPSTPHLWRLGVALCVALLVLGVAAVGVSRRLARPLEDVAIAAERFGDGDLSARTVMASRPRRWVAAEVADVASAFDRMAERIEGVVRDQRELLAAISHELRSPLARARVALEIARDRSADHAPFDDVERQLGEVDAILGDLLAAARAGLSDLRKERTKLLPWLRVRVAAESGPESVEITAPDDAEVLELMMDKPLMGRALHNVFANAKNHGHAANRPLDVRVETGAEVVRIVVRDYGPGFPPDVLDRAFEPFVRGDAARSPGGGTGLGLALVRRIAEAHGGHAYAKNVTGAETGAEVGIELPRILAQRA